MEILFENSFVRTKDLAKEMYAHHFFLRRGAVFFHIFFAVCLVLQIVSGVMTGDLDFLIIGLIVFVYAFQIFCYFRMVSLSHKRDLECFAKDPEIVAFVTEDYIEYGTSDGTKSKLMYTAVKSVFLTKNLILLRSQANLLYVLRKDSFKKGTFEEFVPFLKSRGIKIKK